MRLLGRRCGLAGWLLVGCGLLASAQPMLGQASRGDFRLALFGGPAFRTGAATRPFELGMSGDMSLLRTPRGWFGVGVLAEGGLFHPAISGKANFYFSTDAMLEMPSERLRVRPFAVAGYTRLYNATDTAMSTQNAINAGAGMDCPMGAEFRLRLEVRGRYNPADGGHSLVLRIGLVSPDSAK